MTAEDQANALLPTDEQGAETLLAMADEYRAGGSVDAMRWVA